MGPSRRRRLALPNRTSELMAHASAPLWKPVVQRPGYLASESSSVVWPGPAAGPPSSTLSCDVPAIYSHGPPGAEARPVRRDRPDTIGNGLPLYLRPLERSNRIHHRNCSELSGAHATRSPRVAPMLQRRVSKGARNLVANGGIGPTRGLRRAGPSIHPELFGLWGDRGVTKRRGTQDTRANGVGGDEASGHSGRTVSQATAPPLGAAGGLDALS